MLHAPFAGAMGDLLFLYIPDDALLQRCDRCKGPSGRYTKRLGECKKEFEEVSDQWDHYKKTAVCFLSTEALNEVDSTICKAYYYIQMEDDSNASGEVSALQYQLMYLHENQKPTLANIL